MAHFANMVEDAYYDDASYSTVTIEYKDHEGILRAHNVAADRNDTDFVFLQDVEGYRDEVLVARTEHHKRAMSRTFNASIHRAAYDLANEMLERKVKELEERYAEKLSKESKKIEDTFTEKAKRFTRDTNIDGLESGNILHMIQKNTDKDTLFQIKLWALELDEVKESDSETKKNLRKQKSIVEVMQVLDTIINKE